MSSPPRDRQRQNSEKPDVQHAVDLDAIKHECMGCRLVGTAAFISLAGYIYVHGMTELEKKKKIIANANTRWGIGARRLGIQATAIGMLGLAWYRWSI